MKIYPRLTRCYLYHDNGILYPYLYIQLCNGWIYEAFYNELRVYRSERHYRRNTIYASNDNNHLAWKMGDPTEGLTLTSYILGITGRNLFDDMAQINMQHYMFEPNGVYIDDAFIKRENFSHMVTREPKADHYGYSFILPIRKKKFVLDLSIYWCDEKLKKFRTFNGFNSEDAFNKQEIITLYDYKEIIFDWNRNDVTIKDRNILHKLDKSFPKEQDVCVFKEFYGKDRRNGINAYFNVIETTSLENPDLIIELTL